VALFASVGVGTGPIVLSAIKIRSDHICKVRRGNGSVRNEKTDTDVKCVLNDPSEIVLDATHGENTPCCD
jgi:hypothetical protein